MARIACSRGREISRNDEPDRLKVHFKVVVHQDVSHAGYRWPVDLGVPLFVRLADPLRRLTEYLKVANDCVLERSRSKDSICAGCGILGDSANALDRKSTRLNSSHLVISYAVFCLK